MNLYFRYRLSRRTSVGVSLPLRGSAAHKGALPFWIALAIVLVVLAWLSH